MIRSNYIYNLALHLYTPSKQTWFNKCKKKNAWGFTALDLKELQQRLRRRQQERQKSSSLRLTEQQVCRCITNFVDFFAVATRPQRVLWTTWTRANDLIFLLLNLDTVFQLQENWPTFDTYIRYKIDTTALMKTCSETNDKLDRLLSEEAWSSAKFPFLCNVAVVDAKRSLILPLREMTQRDRTLENSDPKGFFEDYY